MEVFIEEESWQVILIGGHSLCDTPHFYHSIKLPVAICTFIGLQSPLQCSFNGVKVELVQVMPVYQEDLVGVSSAVLHVEPGNIEFGEGCAVMTPSNNGGCTILVNSK